jgi:tRNA-dihydrouridine synthase
LRELINEFGGCGEYFTEMISAGALCAGGPFETWYVDAGPRPEKTVYQLVGGEAEKLANAADLLDKRECRGIDINMGCSAPAITRTGAGVRWMESIERSKVMIAMVRQVVTHRLSVKLRIGFEDDFDYLCRFCRSLEEEGVELITLHPLTAREKFKRRARWEYVTALKRELRIPVAGNGDISSMDDIIRHSRDCDAVMIGRLAVRQPWIFSQEGTDTGDTLRDKIGTDTFLEETGLRFLELLAKHQPPEFHLSRARRFFSYFCDNLKWGNYVKTLLNREEDLAGIERAWKGYFRENGDP